MTCNVFVWRRCARFMTGAILAATLIQSYASGASLFSVTGGNRRINEINADTGDLINSFAAPIQPQEGGGSGLAHSGSALYFSDITTPTIYRIDPATGAVLGTFAHPQGGAIDALGFGATSYGATLFTLNYNDNRVSLLNPTTGALLATYVVRNDLIGGMDFHAGRNSLFVSGTNNTVYELNPTSGALLGSFLLGNSNGSFQVGVGIVEGRLFTAPQNIATISERNPTTGALINSFASPGGAVSALAGAYVPEPSSCMLAAIVSIATLARWRKRSVETLARRHPPVSRTGI